MKFKRNVELTSNLEAVVVHDLRDIGVKIPKVRKQSEQQIHSLVSVSIDGREGTAEVCGLRMHPSEDADPQLFSISADVLRSPSCGCG